MLSVPYTVLDVPLNWLFDPVIVLDESFGAVVVVLGVGVGWLLVRILLNLDLSANKA